MLKSSERVLSTCLSVLALSVASLLSSSCSSPRVDLPPEDDSATSPASAAPSRPAEPPALQGLLRVSKSVFCGGEPHGDPSFAELERLGVRTIVSVDGARPKVDLARKRGLRYVHIPIGYDGIGEEARGALARLVRDADGPFYIHCHHGRHRGPAAAAIASMAAGEMDSAEARGILERAGTSERYAGLWRDVEDSRLPPADAPLPELVEVAVVGSFAAAMAQIDRACDNLKLCRDTGWTTPPDQPDLVPSREALLLREGLHESARALSDGAEAELRAWLLGAEESARALEGALESGDRATATAEFRAVSKACGRCHSRYRD